MHFLISTLFRFRVLARLLCIYVPITAAQQNAELSLSAVISNKGLGCELILPQTSFYFKSLTSNQLTGAIQTYEVQPLQLQLSCANEHEELLPVLTLKGETPYTEDTQRTIFMNGTPNGVGFMVRQSPDNKPIPLADFYQPNAAIGAGDRGHSLEILNQNNLYQSNPLLFVGLVGPLQTNIKAGSFYASLTLNIEYQ